MFDMLGKFTNQYNGAHSTSAKTAQYQKAFHSLSPISNSAIIDPIAMNHSKSTDAPTIPDMKKVQEVSEK
jgi:hypothetical protein